MQTLANAGSSSCGAGGAWLLALAAGALSALAFAPFYAFPILLLTVPVLVWLIDGAEAEEGAGWLAPPAAGGRGRLGVRLRLLPRRACGGSASRSWSMPTGSPG